MNNIIVDIDDTIIDTTYYFDKWLRQQYYYNGSKLYDIDKSYSELNLWDDLLEFFESDEYITIPIRPKCIDVLTYLSLNNNIIFVSSCGLTEKIRFNRISLLKNNFDFDFKLELLELNADKALIIDQYPPLAIFEDNIFNANYAAHMFGSLQFIIRTSLYRNKYLSQIDVYNDWSEIKKIIIWKK